MSASQKVFDQVFETALRNFSSEYEIDSSILDTLRVHLQAASRGVNLPARVVVTTEEGATTGKARTQRAPRATRTVRSGYNVFIQERFRQAKENQTQEEGATGVKRMTQFGGEWRALSDSEREHYNQLAREQSEALRQDVEASQPTETSETTNAETKAPAHTGPRRLNAYNMFYKNNADSVKAYCLEAKARGETIKFMSEIGARWKALSEEERQPYQTQADEENVANGLEVATQTA
jgi:HMG-box domain